jgi:hypothetical protein
MVNELRQDEDTSLTKAAISIDPRLLADLTRSLLPYLGSYSITTVKRAARTTTNPTELIRQVASHIDDIAKREVFMVSAMRILSEYSATVMEASASERATTVEARPASSITPEVVQRGEAALAPIIGPLAGVLVSRYASVSQNSREFFERLAAHLRTPEERDSFFMSVRTSNGTWHPE